MKTNTIITIGRQYGSGGKEIGHFTISYTISYTQFCFLNLFNKSLKYSGKGASNSMYSPVDG